MATKICKVCGLEKEAIQGIWVMRHGKPSGRTCLACARKAHRKKVFDPETGELRSYNGLAQKRRSRKAWKQQHPAKQRLAEARIKQSNSRLPPSSQRWYARLVAATPKWLSDAQWAAMDVVYLESRALGSDYVVDHIIGLHVVDATGAHIACGLHVPWNLRVIHNVENVVKGQALYEELV